MGGRSVAAGMDPARAGGLGHALTAAAEAGGPAWRGPGLFRSAGVNWSGIAAIAACLLLALLLRLQALDGPALWVDEVASFTMIALPWAELVGPIARLEPNPPGYYALLKLAVALTGTSDAGLRLPSALAGAAAVVPLALFTRRALGPWPAAMAALLLAVSAAHIQYSQQARTYAVLFLATVTALWLTGLLLDPGATPRQRRVRLALLALLCVAMVHLHTTAVFIVAALFVQATVTLLAAGRLDRAWLGRLALAGLGVLAGSAWWLSIALRIGVDPDSAITWIQPPGLAELALVTGNMLGALYLGRLWGFVALLCLGLLGLAAVLAWRRRQPEALGLLAALGFGVVALFAFSQLRPVLLDRTALFLLAFALPLYGFALASPRAAAPGQGRRRPSWIRLGLAALLLLLLGRGAMNRQSVLAQDGHGEDWRGAVAGLARGIAPGEPVIVFGSFELGAIPHYAPALVASGTPLRGIPVRSDRLGRTVLERLDYARPFDPAELCRLAGAAPGLWTLGREDLVTEEAEEFTELLARRHGSRILAEEGFEQVVLRHWSAPHQGCGAAPGG